MTIDEAIAHAREVAKENRYQAITYDDDFLKRFLTSKEKCKQCAEEHEQLAEWLEDYKRVKKWKDEIMEEFCRYDASSIEELMQRARNKAIDDFVNACKDDILCQSFGLHANGIERIAEQLKAGGIDGNERTDT